MLRSLEMSLETRRRCTLEPAAVESFERDGYLVIDSVDRPEE